jgi:hypothetical protein
MSAKPTGREHPGSGIGMTPRSFRPEGQKNGGQKDFSKPLLPVAKILGSRIRLSRGNTPIRCSVPMPDSSHFSAPNLSAHTPVPAMPTGREHAGSGFGMTPPGLRPEGQKMGGRKIFPSPCYQGPRYLDRASGSPGETHPFGAPSQCRTNHIFLPPIFLPKLPCPPSLPDGNTQVQALE